MEKGSGPWDRPLPSQRTPNADVMDIDEALKQQPNCAEMDVEDDCSQGSNSSLSNSATDKEFIFATTKCISNEKKKLSYQERNIINEEIHGVACNVQDETPEMVQYSLSKLSSELEDLVLTDWRNNATGPSSLSAGFLLSRRDFGTDTYINEPSFRLRFLRSDNFDAKKAATRLMKFLNLVLEVFGAYALSRPIKLTDFKRNELKALQNGWLQVLPFRDRSGRRLFIWTGHIGMQCDPILRIKITIYIMMAGTRDVESQRKGIVATVFPGRFQQSSQFSFNVFDAFKRRSSHLTYMSYAYRAIEAMPLKCRALHYCLFLDEKERLNPIQRISVDMSRRVMTSILLRTNLHVGGPAEIRNILSSYGIPVGFIPATQSGAVKTVEFKKWLKLQRRIDDLETATENIPFIDCPGSNDVVFRAGSSMIANPGNVMFRSLVEAKVQELISNVESTGKLPQKTKEDVAMEIIDEILQLEDARFLWWDNGNGCWVEFDDLKHVRSKIAITYRDLKLRILKARQNEVQA